MPFLVGPQSKMDCDKFKCKINIHIDSENFMQKYFKMKKLWCFACLRLEKNAN